MLVTPKVYVVLVNYKGYQDTIRAVESLIANDYPNYQIIVVDNDSQDDSLLKISSWATSQNIHNQIFNQNNNIENNNKLTLIQSNSNGGFAKGNNIAINHIIKWNDYRYIWLLNNDTQSAPNTISSLVYRARELKSQNIGILGTPIIIDNQRDRLQSIGGGKIEGFFKHINEFERHQKIDVIDKYKIYKKDRFNMINGASFFITRKVIEDVGLLDESYFMYAEETDYCLEVYNRGFSMDIASDTYIYHKGSASVGSSYAPFVDYYFTRNSIRLIKKFFPDRYYIYMPYIIFKKIIKRIVQKRFSNIKYLLIAGKDAINNNMEIKDSKFFI